MYVSNFFFFLTAPSLTLRYDSSAFAIFLKYFVSFNSIEKDPERIETFVFTYVLIITTVYSFFR